MFNLRWTFWHTWIAAILLLSATTSFAASPLLSSVMPRGGQRGSEVDLILSGDRLTDAVDLLFYDSGLTLKKLEVVDAKQVKAKIAIAADASLGEHALRVHTGSGLSELRTFWVGAMPPVDEVEPNSDFSQPQKITLNCTVAGLIDNEDVDYFVVDVKKDQRLSVEVEGIRLGEAMFDPYVAILDANRFELAASDDTALLLQDPIASILAPHDGAYIIQVRESSYGGNASCHYRLHVGTFPRPKVLFPAGGKAGKDLAAQFVGDPKGPIAQSIHLPENGDADLSVFAEQEGQPSPSPNRLRVSPFDNSLEAEPNNEPKSATTITTALPLALNGVISPKADRDFFRIIAKKGQVFDVNVFARRVRSSLDPVLDICDANGSVIASNDDTAGPDSYLRWPVPADGDYLISVRDQLGAGGDAYVYRIEVTPVGPKVFLTLPLVAANSQERQTIVVPKGNQVATLMRATRADVAGEIAVNISNLPPGVTVASENVAANLDVTPVVFEAAADAPVGAVLCDVIGKSPDPNVPLLSEFSQLTDLVVFGNQVPYYQVRTRKLAVAVAEAAPFKLTLVQPKVPLVQTGSMQLKVVAERKSGFTAPIALSMLFNPPGIGSGGATIPEGASEVTLPINAAGDAQVRKWKICVVGVADVAGALWVSSQLIDLDVAPPFLAGKIDMAASEQGKPAQVVCRLEQKLPFQGKAKVQLVGLPPNTSTVEKEITATDASVVFDVQTNEKSPPGQHNTLFCAVTIVKEGEPIVQSIAAGGVLRIDVPAAPVAAPVAAAPAAPAPPAAVTEKPLSRLEKLRQEQAQKK